MKRTVLAVALVAVVPAAGRADDAGVATQIVDALNARYGVHPGYRSNHAKGIVVEGTFTPSPQAAALTRSPIYAGATLRVTVRFSDASGLPDVPDASSLARPHGMSIKFHLPDGSESDIVADAFAFFPVATPEEFRDLQIAAATSPPGGPASAQLAAFLASHPSVERATATLGTPNSFADERYHGVDAFVFSNAQGRRQPFRYVISPARVVHLNEREAASRSADFLLDELPVRIAASPVTFHLQAQLAASGDQTKDPTRPWPTDRPVADLGVLTIDRTVADSDAAERRLLFTPGRLTEGIEPSDDPLIAARDAAYAVSYERRRPAP
jgi:catalase